MAMEIPAQMPRFGISEHTERRRENGSSGLIGMAWTPDILEDPEPEYPVPN
jgi:hypothetical protein